MPRKKTVSDDEPTTVKQRKRRAAKSTDAAEAETALEETVASEAAELESAEEPQIKKRRGRAKKETETASEETPKPRRGRRKKIETSDTASFFDGITETAARAEAPVVAEKKPARRGRPPKNPKPQQTSIFPSAEESEVTEREEPKVSDAPAAGEKFQTETEAGLPAEKPSGGDRTESRQEQPSPEETPQPEIFKNERGQVRHQHPKLGFSQLAGETLAELRKIAKETGVTSITTRRKDDLINDILKTQAEALGYRFNGGTLECMQEGYGFLRPSGLLPSNNDIYVSASQIRRFGLRNGDVVWGIIRPPKEQEHYEALLRVENVNFTDPEDARRRPQFEALTPIFPNEKLQLETDRLQIATRIVDIFAPIGKGQRALIVSPPKAGKTTLLKNIAHSITTNHPEVILMVLLIDERPEEVTDMARSVDGEIIASTFDRPAEEHLRVAGLALEKAKRLVEVSKDVVLLLDSITRLARASNLVVPPSGRTLSGGMDPAALYFPKKFFGAARNIENGGSLTIIGTSLVETGSRMDDVIYEEFKGTGNMEVHLSRKIAEQRIFPALDITKSGTRKEELMVPEADLQRIWALRRKIANMDEAEVLNLILDRLRNTSTNRDFLATIKVG